MDPLKMCVQQVRKGDIKVKRDIFNVIVKQAHIKF